MSAYPYFSASLPQWTWNAEGEGPSVEAVCAEAVELLDRKDRAVLAYIFSPAYHKQWMAKIKAGAGLEETVDPTAGAFEPACLIEDIEHLPYMQVFATAYGAQCAARVAAMEADASASGLAGGETAVPTLSGADGGEVGVMWSDTEAYRRLQALFYAEVPHLSSAFLRAYYRFDWEWKTVANRLNRKKYPASSMDSEGPAFPAKGDRAAADAEWLQELDRETLSLVWDYAEDMAKAEAESDVRKREFLCDTFRWRYAEAWGGDATASTDYLWAYFIRLQLQQRWQRLKASDGAAQLKDKLQALRAVDWNQNAFSALAGA